MNDAAELERRLNAGGEPAWLTPGEVGVLFGRDRSTIHRWIKAGRFGYRESIGGHRVCDPADVIRELAQWRETKHSGAP
jgi:hypothetical protein